MQVRADSGTLGSVPLVCRRKFNAVKGVARRFRRPVSDKLAADWRKPLLRETADKLNCLARAEEPYLLPACQL